MEFVDILAAVRGGQSGRTLVEDLKLRCSRPLDVSDGILPTKVRWVRTSVAFIASTVAGDQLKPSNIA